jgi:hypothetical protein
MKIRSLIGIGIFSIMLTACTREPAKNVPVNIQTPKPTSITEITPTTTLDLCATYVNDVLKIATKFDEDMIKIEADIKNNEMNNLSWDLSQILNFTKSKVEVLKPPAQYESFNQTFLDEISAYQDGASAYLMANPAGGKVKFQNGETIGKTRKVMLLELSCPK